MRGRERVDKGLAASLLVAALFVGATVAAVVAVDRDRGDPVATRPQPDPVPVAVARQSAVLVDASGCPQDSAGSGVVVGDGVVTNAHVVAGATEVRVTTTDGEEFPATVGAFDPVRDLALLVVPELAVRELKVAAPLGGTDATALVRADDRVEAIDIRISRTINIVSTDIYGEGEHRRRGLELEADIDAGDSGGAVVDARGDVVGIVFSASRRQLDVAYAVSAVELEDLVAAAGTVAVDTGPCLRS